MTAPSPEGPPPDASRDRRIEDPSNLWLIHPLGRRLLPLALRLRVSANMVSIGGLTVGALAALAYARMESPAFAVIALILSALWLVMDGLDGMVARATGTASPLGRVLDGMCDHGVFCLIYVSLALEVGTIGGWVLAVAGGAAHAVQSSLYEGERARFHRRARGLARPDMPAAAGPSGPLVRLYDAFAGAPDRLAHAFERRLAAAPDPQALGTRYAAAAVAPMRLLALQTANVRVFAIFIACVFADPRLFWWFEIGPLSLLALVGLWWHRRVEHSLLSTSHSAAAAFIVKEQGH